MQSFRYISSASQRCRQIINTPFGAAEDDAFSFDTRIQQTGNSFDFITGLKIILINQRHRDFFFTHRYYLGSPHVFFGQAKDRTGHGRGKQHGLPFRRNARHDFFHVFNKTHVQHFIRFVQNKVADIVQLDRPPADMIQQASRRADDDLHTALQGANLPFNRLAAVNGNYFDAFIKANLRDFFRNLDCQFTGGAHNQRLNMPAVFNPLDNGNAKRSRFPCAGLCLPDYIPAFQQ